MKFKRILTCVLITSLLILSCLCFVTTASTGTKILKTPNYPNGVTHYGTGNYVEIVNEYSVPYSEMRGVWVATVYNIAIAKQEGTTEEAIEAYKKEYLSILDRMATYGMNTIFFQVRPCNDAFYQSDLNPWSKFLVSEGTNPGWDPLEWMIDVTHKRGYTFMCWMNAFRVTTDTYVTTGANAASFSTSELVEMKLNKLNQLADGNFAKEHPEYVLAGIYDEKLILNPSEPAVQKFIVDTIMEIVENYDVDGLHFDDYFYLNGYVASDTQNTNFAGGQDYKESGENILNDWSNYEEYKKDPINYGKDVFGSDGIYGMKAGLSLGDFRRENINNMMRNIRKEIDAYNLANDDHVEFGTKPAAVWRSNSEYCSAGSPRCHENGSNTHEYAYSTYNNLYADSLAWVEEGLVDWVAPQVYYGFESTEAPYADIVMWWAEQVERINLVRKQEGKKDIRLYIAHGIYKYRDAPNEFYNSSEMLNQLFYNNKFDAIKGSAVYSYEILYKKLGTNVTSNYPNAEDVRSAAMYQFRKLWSGNQVFPLEVGKDDSKGLILEDYNLKNTKDGNVILTYKVIPNARAYGIYKVPSNVAFDDKLTEYREQVIYAGYEENKKITIDLGLKSDLESDYKYYIVPVSTNGYVSETETMIDISKSIDNVAPNSPIIEIENYGTEMKTGSAITASFDIPTDLNDDELTYSYRVIENGIERAISPTIKITNNKIYFTWKSYFYQVNNCQLKVIVSDGDLTNEGISKSFDLVDSVSPQPVVITTDKTAYNTKETLIITYTDIVDLDTPYPNVQVNLVVDNKKTDITADFRNGNSNQFSISLTQPGSECYIEFIVSDGYNEVISKSENFTVTFKNNLPTGGKIEITSDNFEPLSIVNGIVTLPVDNDNDQLTYELVFVCNGSEEEVSLSSDNKFEIYLPDVEASNCYLELRVSDGFEQIKISSQKFDIKIVEVEDEKGCSSCKKDSILTIQSFILLLSSAFLILRRTRKIK